MDRWLVILMFVVFTYVPTYSYGQDGDSGGNRPKPYEWQPQRHECEIWDRRSKLSSSQAPGSVVSLRDCKFDLHYFFGEITTDLGLGEKPA